MDENNIQQETDDIVESHILEPEKKNGQYSTHLVVTAILLLTLVAGVSYVVFKTIKSETLVTDKDEPTEVAVRDNGLGDVTENDTVEESLESDLDATRGYLEKRVVKKLVSDSGNILTLTVFYNKPNYSDNCVEYTFQDGAVSEAIPLRPEGRICEVSIETENNTYTYTNSEIQKLGGVPERWISDNVLSVHTVTTEELVFPGIWEGGIFNVDTQKYEKIVSTNQLSTWLGKEVVIGDQRYILISVLKNATTSILYKINSARTFEDFFIPGGELDSYGGSYYHLDQNKIAELSYIGTLGEPSHDVQMDVGGINSDGSANIIFKGKYDYNYFEFILDPRLGTLEESVFSKMVRAIGLNSSTALNLIIEESDVGVSVLNQLLPLERNLLHRAVRFGTIGVPEHKKIMQTLIDQGVDKNHQDVYLYTPLHIATNPETGNMFAVDVLLKNDVNVTIKNKSGKTVFDSCELTLEMYPGNAGCTVLLKGGI